ncbi:MAG: DUF418 domain-containing protein [Phycisphaerales bacterium]
MNEHAIDPPRPVEARSRIESLDVIRGFALLGILGPNILAFALPQAALYDAGAIDIAVSYLGLTPHTEANQIGHWIVDVFFFGKMMLLFSLLFGAGVVMYARKFESPDGSWTPLSNGAGLWYRRSAWLLVIGLVHAFGLWYGDILVWYAVAALGLIWWARRLRPDELMVLGGALYLLGNLGMIFLMLSALWAQEMGYHSFRESVIPEIEAHRGVYADVLAKRTQTLGAMYVFMIPFAFFWMASGMFAWGIALTKLRVLTGERSGRFYARLALFALSGGLAATIIVRWIIYASGVPMPGFVFQTVGQLLGVPTALGYAALLILLARRRLLRPVAIALAAVGRMALSNYLLQTILCTTYFYGYGLGHFGEMQYPALFVFMGCVWIVNIAFSLVWGRFFRFGPAEWLWRSLTYWKLQPIRREFTPRGAPGA